MIPMLNQVLDACRSIQTNLRALGHLPEQVKLLIRKTEVIETKLDKLIKESADSRKPSRQNI